MKLGIDRSELAAITSWAGHALGTHPSLPVMAGILLHASGGGTLTAAAADPGFDVIARATAAARVDEPGSVLVPGRLLAQAASVFRGEVAELAAGDDGLLGLRCDGAGFSLRLLDAGQYPTLPELPAPAGTCQAGDLAATAARAALAAGTDDTLPVLTGIRLQAGADSLTMAATNRYRFAAATLPWTAASADGAGLEASVPARVLARAAKNLAGTVTVGFARPARECTMCYGQPAAGSDADACPACDGAGRIPDPDAAPGAGLASFSDSSRQLITRCIAGEFPRWEPQFSRHQSVATTRAGELLAAAIRHAAITADTRPPIVSLRADDGLLTVGADGEAGSSTLDCDAQVDGELPAGLMFNPEFLVDGLDGAGDAACVSFGEAGRPALITSADGRFRYLLMPVSR